MHTYIGQKANVEWTSAKEIDNTVSKILLEGTSQGSSNSLYTIDENLIKSLQPVDIILTQNICAVCAIDLQSVRKLANNMSPSPEIISLDPDGLNDVLKDIQKVGNAVNLSEAADGVVQSLNKRIENVITISENALMERPLRKRVGFIEWPEPLYVGGHWTPQMIHIAGGEHGLNLPVSIRKSSTSDTRTNSINESQNLFTKKGESFSLLGGFSHAGKSFPVSSTTFADYDPELIIIAPCGLNLEAAEREAKLLYDQKDSNGNHWFRDLRAVQEGNVVVVDGDAMFNRPGPRLIDALEWLVGILHPQIEAARILQEKNFPSKFLTF